MKIPSSKQKCFFESLFGEKRKKAAWEKEDRQAILPSRSTIQLSRNRRGRRKQTMKILSRSKIEVELELGNVIHREKQEEKQGGRGPSELILSKHTTTGDVIPRQWKVELRMKKAESAQEKRKSPTTTAYATKRHCHCNTSQSESFLPSPPNPIHLLFEFPVPHPTPTGIPTK